MRTWTRKDFLKASLLTGSAALLTRSALGAPAVVAPGSPNGDVRVAVVGFNGKGAQHIKTFGDVPGVRVVALCDVDSDVLAAQVKKFADRGQKVAAYRDYRELLNDKSIDAVVIATPNHWHALMTIWACQAGKDIYVEKPVSHSIWEGRKAVEAARKYNRVVQTGTQSRSDEALREFFAYLQAGNLGAVKWARGLGYKARPSIGKTSGPQPLPASVDYDLWLGPAAMTPLRRQKLHYDWHWFWATGNADIGNQGAHQMDMCRLALGQKGLPPSVMCIGGRFAQDDDAETPNTQIVVLPYEPAPLIFEVRGLPRKAGDVALDNYRGIRIGITVQCENGYFVGSAGGGWVYDNDNKRVKHFEGTAGATHAANFIDAVRQRRREVLNADIEEGHITAALCHCANISYRLGQDTTAEAVQEAIRSDALTRETYGRLLEHLRANQADLQKTPIVQGPCLSIVPGREAFVSNAKGDLGDRANALLKDTYRAPFVVPENV
ncbi:MAG: Gfo/Idh/MocA family oxidoreductase [Opitutae bacterium]|nr:Gfo/Idh/MocA family oxidoreductase [Opitutae bacterium]